MNVRYVSAFAFPDGFYVHWWTPWRYVVLKKKKWGTEAQVPGIANPLGLNTLYQWIFLQLIEITSI